LEANLFASFTNKQMRSILLVAVFIALVAFAKAQKFEVVSKTNSNTIYRCDFNIPNLGAKNESVICEPNRMIETSFNVTITGKKNLKNIKDYSIHH
jgi:hypothetical protein